MDKNKFLSPYGIRSMSADTNTEINGRQVKYEPAESSERVLGGNSNWRGPIWFPTNYLIIQSLRKFGDYYMSRNISTSDGRIDGKALYEIANDISERLINIFRKDASGKRPVNGDVKLFNEKDDWANLILFYEHFHGDNGAGLGASHQTGWTGLIANIIQEYKILKPNA